jgi:hypothetical protein
VVGLFRGAIKRKALERLIGPSQIDSRFENSATRRTDYLTEGLYLRTEAAGVVSGRARLVRPDFLDKVKESTRWQRQAMGSNLLGA